MDMMTRIAALTADCLASAWPEAEGLPDAGEIRGLLAVPPDLLGAARAMLEADGDLACEVGEVLPPRRDGKALLLR